MGCTRQGPFQGGQYLAFREKPDSIPATVALQQVKTGKFHFRKGLGRVGQSWQGVRPGQSEIAQSHHNQGVGQIPTPPPMDSYGD